MGSVISSVTSLIGTSIKYSFYSAILAIICAGTFTISTNPTDKSFKEFINQKVKSGFSESGSPIALISSSIFSGIATNIGLSVTSIEIRDLKFCKIATCRIGGKTTRFFGVAGGWHGQT